MFDPIVLHLQHRGGGDRPHLRVNGPTASLERGGNGPRGRRNALVGCWEPERADLPNPQMATVGNALQ